MRAEFEQDKESETIRKEENKDWGVSQSLCKPPN